MIDTITGLVVAQLPRKKRDNEGTAIPRLHHVFREEGSAVKKVKTIWRKSENLHIMLLKLPVSMTIQAKGFKKYG